MADIFISYARSGAKSAAQLVAALREHGYSVWFDENLPAHRAYSEVIEEQLELAAAVVVLWSADAVRSQWVRSEANRARETGRLVQARLDDARLPMPFDQIQCADLQGWRGGRNAAAWTSLEDSVAALVGGERPAVVLQPSAFSIPDRRQLLMGGGAVAAVAAGGFYALRGGGGRKEPPSPEASLLLQKGIDALQQVDALDTEQPGSAGPAVALLTKATEAIPDDPRAWGSLAMAYAAQWRASGPGERPGMAERTRSAAERALALETNEPRALAAQQMIEPVYRNWQPAERSRKKAHLLDQRFPIHIFLYSDVLGSVGRCREAAAVAVKADRSRFLIPGADRKVVSALWSAGRLQEADRALGEAVARWPEHTQVWRTRLAYLLYSGRAPEALTLIDSKDRPAAIPDLLVKAARATALVLAGQGNPGAAVAASLDFVREYPLSAPQVAQACAAVGDGKAAMSVLNGYYFGEAPWASLVPPGGDSDRVTTPLFQPPMRGLWRTSEFGDLLQRTGLEDYWRKSGTAPDFRA